MLDTKRSFGFGNVLCVTENEFHEIDQKFILQ